MTILDKNDIEIVQTLEKNESRQFTEAAHAEMMRRQISAYQKGGNRIFWLTVFIAFLGFSNLVVGILNFIYTGR